MNRLPEACPTMATGSGATRRWAAGTRAIRADATRRRVAAEIPASTGAAEVPRTRAAALAEVRSRDLLHPALLLIERDMIHARRLHTARKTLCPRLWEIPAHGAVRHPETGSIRRHREHSMHQPSLLNLTLIETREAGAPAKFTGIHAGNAARYPRIAINISDVDVVDNRGVISVEAIPEPTVETSAPPGVEYFKGGQRHPPNSAKTEADAEASPTPAKETNVRRRPEVA